MTFQKSRQRTGWMVGYILVLLLFFIILAGIVISKSNNELKSLTAKQALVEIIGMPSLSISADCTGTKNLLEGLCGCLSEIPGGYCYHTDCDTVASPDFIESESYVFERLSRR